jgi:hypothetical protein
MEIVPSDRNAGIILTSTDTKVQLKIVMQQPQCGKIIIRMFDDRIEYSAIGGLPERSNCTKHNKFAVFQKIP